MEEAMTARQFADAILEGCALLPEWTGALWPRGGDGITPDAACAIGAGYYRLGLCRSMRWNDYLRQSDGCNLWSDDQLNPFIWTVAAPPEIEKGRDELDKIFKRHYGGGVWVMNDCHGREFVERSIKELINEGILV